MTTKTGSIAVVANPVGAEKEAAQLRELLETRAIDVVWFDTTPEDAGVGQTRRAIDTGAELVIACGGDGTVRSCLQSAAGTKTSIGIIPAGTGNLLARNLGIPIDPLEALDVILTGHKVSIDLGYVEDEAFAVMAGIGLDARVMQETDRESKQQFGTAAYVATAARHLDDHLFQATVTLDGDEPWTGAVASVLVANHGRLQAGVDLFPDASAHDGRLDVLAASAKSLSDWARTAWAVLRDDPSVGPIERFTSHTITVDTLQPVPYQIDGEERDPIRSLTFSVVADAVNVIAPREEQK